MSNHAKINLEISQCLNCPFAKFRPQYGEWFCTHDITTIGISVGDGSTVPDFCPFVLQRLQHVIQTIHHGSEHSIPKSYITKIEQLQQSHHPNLDAKFGADHGWHHLKRTYLYGADFLEQCVCTTSFSNPDLIQKQKLLLEIATILHDIGLAISPHHHAAYSAEIASDYLSSSTVDISPDDATLVTHAIANHSQGRDTNTIIDAALLLGDKLDVTKARIIHACDGITTELLKIDDVQYHLVHEHQQLTHAVLEYTTSAPLNLSALHHWPKCITIPYYITTHFLQLPTFRFLINGQETAFSEFLPH